MPYDINTAPRTLEEWEQLIEYRLSEDKARYDRECVEAREAAAKQVDARNAQEREKRVAQLEAQLKNEMVSSPEGNRSLTEAEVAAKLAEGLTAIDTELARDHEEQLRIALSFIQPAVTRKDLERTYNFLKPQPETEVPVELVGVQVSPYDSIWTDGEQYWDVAHACFIKQRNSVDQSRVVVFGSAGVSSFEQNIRENIKFYSQSDSRIKLGPEVMDTEELFTLLRERRSERLAEYDQKIAQLDRQIRENPEYATYSIQRAAWDAYATALCSLPSQDGAPWDGGGLATPWPAKPE